MDHLLVAVAATRSSWECGSTVGRQGTLVRLFTSHVALKSDRDGAGGEEGDLTNDPKACAAFSPVLGAMLLKTEGAVCRRTLRSCTL